MNSCVKKSWVIFALVQFLLVAGFQSLSQSNARPNQVSSNRNIPGSRTLQEFSLLLERSESGPSQSVSENVTPRIQKPNKHEFKGMETVSRPGLANKLNYAVRINPLSEVCFTISGRDFINHSSIGFYTADPIRTRDGNFIIPGEFVDYNHETFRDGGYCMKTDADGNLIWMKLFDSTNQSPGFYLYYFKVLELNDGSFILLGRTPNQFSGNSDLIITKLDAGGNQLWSKTFESRFWEGYGGSGDFFNLTDLEQDPADGQIYFVAAHWGTKGVSITKMSPVDGTITWSNVYQSEAMEVSFGMAIQSDQLILFNARLGYHAYIVIGFINKISGEITGHKALSSTLGRLAPTIYRPYEMVVTESGNFLLSGGTTGYYRSPNLPSPERLSHAEVLELDQNANFKRSYLFQNPIESAPLLTLISLANDGTGVFTMFDYKSGYVGDAYVSIFKEGKIYHQRKRKHVNEGIPFETFYRSIGNGGFVNIKLLGDSLKTLKDGSRIDFYKMHSSDTLGECIGFPDSLTTLFYKSYIPVDLTGYTIAENDLSEQPPIRLSVSDEILTKTPACQIISHCDSVSILADQEAVCVGSMITVKLGKNPACGSNIPLDFDSGFVGSVQKKNDSIFSFQLVKAGEFKIRASVLGCSLKEDSVVITVTPAQTILNLGADTVLCENNSILLKADDGFLTYRWQDGTESSEFTVNQPGKYYVDVSNACGNFLSDTILVKEHPPILLSLGMDKELCYDQPVTIEAPEGFNNYEWSNSMDQVLYQGRSLLFRSIQPIEYRVKAELSPGCFAFDTIQLSISRPPVIDLGDDTSICRTSTLLLDAGAGFSFYQWSTGEVSNSISVSEKAKYWVKGYLQNGCFSTDTLELVEVHELPLPYLGPDRPICEGTSELLQPLGFFTDYLWQDGSISRAIQINQPGTFWLRAENNFGCTGSDTLVITEYKKPPADFLKQDTLICNYSTIELVPERDFSNYKWSNGSTSQTIQVKTQGIFRLTVTDEFNCSATDSILVTTKDCLKGVFLPNAFSPNGDRKNDHFRAQVFGLLQKFELRVYNRFGQLIFETTNPESGWNGTLNGLLQNSGTYIWTCNYQFNGEPAENQKGTLQLLR